MEAFEVRILTLEPMRAVSALGYGPEPEGLAWGQLAAWVLEQGLLGELESHRFFGFNNPGPAEGTPNYGYEQWMTVGAEVEPGALQTVEFPGGQYAVARCEGVPNIPPTWEKLVAWLESSAYRYAPHQWLEELLTPADFLPEMTEDGLNRAKFDLYMPIAPLE